MTDFSRTGLPLVPFLPQISEVLEKERSLALTAEPGAGKSTLVPPYLLDEPWLSGRSIVMLEPRRLAAVAVAARIAELLGEPVGRRAGYRVRTASRVGRETRIEVVTEALLTRRIQEDPLLQGVGLVIFDEFHERSIHADCALALALEVRRARPDLALLAMSATLDAAGVADLLGGDPDRPATSLRCPGTLHPVRTEYRPLPAAGRWEEAFADGLGRLFEETDRDLLAFLPGAGEIRRVGARLAGALGARAEVLPLHGTLRLEEQRRVISPPEPPRVRRVILATSIAETSLTVPGVSTVADSGWARLSRLHQSTGLDMLVTERVGVSSAEQRRGRAGRLGPGLCVRFWPEAERLQDRADPEILRTDLAGLVLECTLWGARAAEDLRWMDRPSPAAWSQARETLSMLGLVNADGPTALGRTVAGLGLSPRLGILAARGAATGAHTLAAACAALLQERDGSGLRPEGTQALRDPDFRLRLEMIRSGRGGSESWRRAVETEMGRILRRLASAHGAGEGGAGENGAGGAAGGVADPRGGSAAGGYGWTTGQEDRVGSLLAGAFPDRLARREPDGSYRLVTGRRAQFPTTGGGASGRVVVPSRAAAPWIVALDAEPGETTGTIRLAAPVESAEAERALAFAADEAVEIRWEGLVPKGALVRRAGRLVLTERPARPEPEAVLRAFQAVLAEKGIAILPWNAQSTRLLARIRFYSRARGGSSPERLSSPALSSPDDLSDAGLVARSAEWLSPYLKLTGGQVMTAGGLYSALRTLAGQGGGRIDIDVPESVTLPTGGKRAIDYEGTEPSVEARIQEVFGLAASPKICGVPLTFRLLSPARRPLQITRDLESFWRTTYAEVRKEMRGRYPKHYWPEDPLTAEPTARVRPDR